MIKHPAALRSFGLMTVLCTSVLTACGGGSDEVSFDIVNPAVTNTPVPTATNTNTPVPTATNTNTPVPTATNTPVPTATDTPVPTATNTPVPTATDTPVPTATNTPVPTATDTPVPTATNTPVPTATDTPVPIATDTPVPTATDTPVSTATNTPVPTATDTPVPTATNTPVPTNTSTPTPPAISCAPAIPVDGQQVKVSMVGEDMQGPDNGQAIYPNLNSDITYTFNAGAGTFSAVASNASYVINPSGTYSPITGNILTAQTPALADPMSDSFVSFTPADWAQRLAKQLDAQPINSTATVVVTLEARGYLPNLLANLNGGSPDPQNEVIQNTYTATATRLANGTVNGVNNACNFDFTLHRHFQYDPAIVLTPGNHGDSGAPLLPTAVDEDAATADITVSGPVLGQFAGDRSSMLFLEPYMPAFAGTFSTSSQVSFVPVKLKWTHVYGISSLSFPTYLNTDGATNSRAVQPASAAAFQEFTYQP